MTHLASVEVLDQQHSEWKVKVPGGIGTVGWTAAIIEEKTYERLSYGQEGYKLFGNERAV